MAGINFGELAKSKGLKPLMGLREAHDLGRDTMVKCPVCGNEPLDFFSQTMIHRYGQCKECLALGPRRE